MEDEGESEIYCLNNLSNMTEENKRKIIGVAK
jgi:hypothetical protein